jgi:hypothetical protein
MKARIRNLERALGPAPTDPPDAAWMTEEEIHAERLTDEEDLAVLALCRRRRLAGEPPTMGEGELDIARYYQWILEGMGGPEPLVFLSEAGRPVRLSEWPPSGENGAALPPEPPPEGDDGPSRWGGIYAEEEQ